MPERDSSDRLGWSGSVSQIRPGLKMAPAALRSLLVDMEATWPLLHAQDKRFRKMEVLLDIFGGWFPRPESAMSVSSDVANRARAEV